MRKRVAVIAVLAGLAALLVWWAWPADAPEVAVPARSEADATGAPETRRGPFTRQRAVPAGEDAGPAEVLTVVDDTDGHPLAGARAAVIARVSHHFARTVSEGLTGPDGTVLLRTPPERCDLSVEADGYFAHFGEWKGRETVALQRIPPMTGRVRFEDGRPAAGALVSELTARGHATTANGQGRFHLQGTEVRPLVAQLGDLVACSGPISWGGKGPVPEIELVLDENLERWTGRAAAADDEPVATALVTLTLGHLRLEQRTDREGRFVVPHTCGHWKARFDHPAFVVLEQELSELRQAQRVVLRRPASLRGRVVTPAGEAVAGAEVELTSDAEGLPRGTKFETTTDGAGLFRLERLPPDSASLFVSLGEQTAEATTRLEEGKEARVDLVLRPPLVGVDLEVLSADDTSEYDAEVVATPVPPAGWSSSGHPAAGIHLARGLFQFSITTSDGRTHREERYVDPVPDMPPLVFRLPSAPDDEDGEEEDEEAEPEPPTETVRVRVVTASGTPVADALVDCADTKAVSGADGRATCLVQQPDSAWPIHVFAQRGELRGTARATGKEPEVTVVVRGKRTVRGRVTGQTPGQRFDIVARGKDLYREQPLQGDTFAVEDLPPGLVYLCARYRGEQNEMGCAVSEDDRDVVIPVGLPGRLTFTAVRADGTREDDPKVYVDRLGTQFTVDAKGRIRVEVVPGTHVLVLNEWEGRARYEARFTIQPGRETALGRLQMK